MWYNGIYQVKRMKTNQFWWGNHMRQGVILPQTTAILEYKMAHLSKKTACISESGHKKLTEIESEFPNTNRGTVFTHDLTHNDGRLCLKMFSNYDNFRSAKILSDSKKYYQKHKQSNKDIKILQDIKTRQGIDFIQKNI